MWARLLLSVPDKLLKKSVALLSLLMLGACLYLFSWDMIIRDIRYRLAESMGEDECGHSTISYSTGYPECNCSSHAHVKDDFSPTPGTAVEIDDAEQIPKIILYGKYRSGSTFTSEFFIKQGTFLYIFEPLRRDGDNDLIVKNHQRALQDYLNCEFTSAEANKTHSGWRVNQLLCQIKDQTPQCARRRKPEVNIIEIGRNVCRHAEARVMKVIRVELLRELESFMSQGVLVVHLVRDPRGIYSSKINLQPGLARDVFRGSVRHCRRLREDLDFIRDRMSTDPLGTRTNYLLVRYEDLADKPDAEMRRIYKFMGITPRPGLLRWVNQTMEANLSGDDGGNEGGNAYSTHRNNPRYTATAWKYSLSWRDTSTLQGVPDCREVMARMGYTLAESEDQLRSTNFSTYQHISLDL